MSNLNLVDELENSFQACFANLTNPENSNVSDQEEIKTSIEQSIQKFMDLSKQTEAFFLQKRLLLSVMKPEQTFRENTEDLKYDITRKEQLLQKHYEKLLHWKNILQSGNQPPPVQQQQPAANVNVSHQQTSQQISGPHMGQASVPQQQMMQLGPGAVSHAGAMQQTHHSVVQSPVHPPHSMGQSPIIGPPLTHQGMHPMHGGTMSMIGPGNMPGINQNIPFPQGPLAHLERTTSNIGMGMPPDGNR